jgi:beta-lactamase class A
MPQINGYLSPMTIRRALFLLPLLVSIAVAQGLPPCCPKAATTDKEAVLWRKLEAEVRDIDAHLDGVIGVAIEDLSSGRTLFLNPDEILPQASSIKIAVVAELYHQHQEGKLKLDDLYTVNAADLVPDSNIMGGLTPGVTRVTNRDLATMMVAVSDNSATNVLIDRVGMENVNAFLESLGLHQVRLRRKMMDLKAAAEGRENVATPREMMTLLDALFRNKVLNRGLTDDFFRILATPKDSWIPRYLPEDLKIANKPGSLEGVRNDSGVIFARRPYILCVMTTYLRNERDGEEAIAQISRAAYRMFDRLGRASEYGRVISPVNSSK